MTYSDKKPTLFKSGFLTFICVCFFSLAFEARALQVTLAWDESPPEDLIKSYRLYYGNGSRNYSSFQRVTLRECSFGVCQHSLELTQGRWYFAVTAVNHEGLESGYSEEVWADLYSDPRLLYPSAAGITWARGCVYEIRWAGFESSSVSLELVGPSGSFTLSSSTPNDGLFQVRIRKKHPIGGGFLVRVEGRQMPQEWDESQETFTILEPQVTTPQEGAVLSRGELVPIRWIPLSFCGDSVSVDLHKGSRRLRSIGSQVPNTGELLWNVPRELRPGSGYKVVIRSETHGACKAASPGGFVIE